jgi:UDP-glucose 4-epimerase
LNSHSVFWKEKNVLVTGGASFIGSHLVDHLLSSGARLVVADDLSSGKIENLEYPLTKDDPSAMRSDNLLVKVGDLRDKHFTESVMKDIDVVFHLAAAHGGRGYIDTHPVECCTNMMLDQEVFQQACEAGVDRICFASSACVYPSYLQEEMGSRYLLREEDADPFVRDKALADLEYGWAKLMAEMTLKAYHRQYGLKTASVRIFTAYGPRENETHAIIALIAKALVKQDPYVIWGTGEQDRNFTYVTDIVNALILAAQKIEDGTPVNAGREDRITINQARDLVFKIINWKPDRTISDTTKPQGVASRAADLSRAKTVLEFVPKVSYEEGFKKTINWYVTHKVLDQVRANLDKLLMER